MRLSTSDTGIRACVLESKKKMIKLFCRDFGGSSVFRLNIFGEEKGDC